MASTGHGIHRSAAIFASAICVLLMLPSHVSGQAKVLLVHEANQQNMINKFGDGLKASENANSGLSVTFDPLQIDREDYDGQVNKTCDKMATESGAYSAIVDLTWDGWAAMRDMAQNAGFPYVRLESSNAQFAQAADDYLTDRDAMDAALIFETESDLEQGLYTLIGNSIVRILVVHLGEADALDRLAKMRPAPNYFVAYGSTDTMKTVYQKAKEKKMIRRDARWTFVFTDWNFASFDVSPLDVQITFVTMADKDCCIVLNKQSGCDCKSLASPFETFMQLGSEILGNTFAKMEANGDSIAPSTWTCYTTVADKARANKFETQLEKAINAGAGKYTFDATKKLFTYPLVMDIRSRNSTVSRSMGTWSLADGYKKATNYQHKPIPRFFRIGTVTTTPWAFYKLDAAGGGGTAAAKKGADQKMLLDGYCIEMIEELAKKMFFDYELILPTDNSNMHGRKNKETNEWNGLIGDLVRGEIDIAVAGMTMTSEREEVVDFVAPYFDQSGISIIIRKPVRPRSLFKFMEVLRVEVWLAILGALVVTALMLWFLDKYSPYSGQNNKEAHPYPFRIFTLKESFWFALTSFTPQGGGEAPKSLSGRVLVAAYWLFVVLMLATFTANLAAFLTVERMQTTVQSLEELAQQSKINYTVVANSPYLEYFKNMAGAEEDLYKVWKDLTLSSNADQSRYRVWDYPIKEQYTHVFKTIKASGLAKDARDGFQRVLNDEEGTFAFVHDAAEIRYEYYNNCNFTEVGEPFAEQPYAVAVQQGSHLQEEISKVILELQKDRYFETLASKYWNSTLRSLCPTLDDSEGITLRSLGGVFIATLTGLAIAMVVLAFEVYMHRKDGKNAVQDISGASSSEKQKAAMKGVTTTTTHGGSSGATSRSGIIQVGSRQVPYDVQY